MYFCQRIIAQRARRDRPHEGLRRRSSTCYARRMIPRYTPPDFADLWTSDKRFKVWLEVELSACEAMERAGLVPEGVAARIRSKNLVLDANRIAAVEGLEGSGPSLKALSLSDNRLTSLVGGLRACVALERPLRPAETPATAKFAAMSSGRVRDDMVRARGHAEGAR